RDLPWPKAPAGQSPPELAGEDAGATSGGGLSAGFATEHSRHPTQEKSQNGKQHENDNRHRQRDVQRGQQFAPLGFELDDRVNIEAQRDHETAEKYSQLLRNAPARNQHVFHILKSSGHVTSRPCSIAI